MQIPIINHLKIWVAVLKRKSLEKMSFAGNFKRAPGYAKD